MTDRKRIKGAGGPPLVSVLTPSVPERAEMLVECEASVRAQTFDSWEQLVHVDHDRDGYAATTNRLARRAVGAFLMPLSDDDLLLPGGLGALVVHAPDADIIYSPPLVTGNEDRWWFFQAPPVIPACALIRTSLWKELGGYDETLRREEDRDFWIKAMDAGARFVRVDEPCWVYRQHAGNKSMVAA